MSRFAPEVASVDVEPVRQEVREASTSFFIGRKGRLVRAAAPVLAHLRPGPRSTRRPSRPSSRRWPASAAWSATSPCPGAGCRAAPPSTRRSTSCPRPAGRRCRTRCPPSSATATCWPGSRRTSRTGSRPRDASVTPLGPAEHRALDAAGRAVSAAVTHTGGSSEDEARFARGRGLLRTWAATAARASRGPATGRRLGAMGRGERRAGAAGRGAGRGALDVVDRRGATGRRTGGPRPRAGRGVGGGAVGRGRVRVVRGGPSGPDGQPVRRRVGAAAVLPDHGASGGPAGSSTVPARRVLRQGRRAGAGDRADPWWPERPAAGRAVRRGDRRDHAVRAGEPGLAGSVRASRGR